MNTDGEIVEFSVPGEGVKRAVDADTAEVDGIIYHMLLMLGENGEPNGDYMVRRELQKGGKIELVPVENPEKYDEISNMFIARAGIAAIDRLADEDGIIELEDEDGNPRRFELVDSMEYNGEIYHAVIPEGDEENFIILKQIAADGGIALGSVDSDAEYDEIGEVFMKRLTGYEDDEE